MPIGQSRLRSGLMFQGRPDLNRLLAGDAISTVQANPLIPMSAVTSTPTSPIPPGLPVGGHYGGPSGMQGVGQVRYRSGLMFQDRSDLDRLLAPSPVGAPGSLTPPPPPELEGRIPTDPLTGFGPYDPVSYESWAARQRRLGLPATQNVYDAAVFRQQGGATPQGDFRFQRPTTAELQGTEAYIGDVLQRLALGGSSDQERVERFQDFYRTLVGTSYGFLPGTEALDPLVQLQQQLQEQYDPGYLDSIQNVDFDQTLAQRQSALNTQLRSQAAGLGVEGAYSGLIGEQQRARQALADRARAAYQPQAFQLRQQLQQQQDALLQAINQAETETERIFQTTGF